MTNYPTAAMIVERLIVKRVIADLLEKYPGPITVNDGEEDVLTSRSESEIYAAMFSTYEDILLFDVKDDPWSFVHFIYGNDGTDVIHDYGMRIEGVMAPINAWIDGGMGT
jgi:hypothetical protein